MTQEEKQLLLQDLSARLPYGVIVRGVFIHYNKNDDKIRYEEIDNKLDYQHLNRYESLKPYLRPMSSMTDEEKAQVQTFMDIVTDENYGDGYSPSAWDAMDGFVQYCDSHHLDHRGLIFRGIALEAPEGMYNI